MINRKTLGILLTITLVGCAGLNSENTGEGGSSICDQKISTADCIKSSYVILGKHDLSADNTPTARLGFIEFSDLGFKQNAEAVDHVFKKLALLNDDGIPLLMVVFVHGWHHNASPDDSNVKSFKQFLVDLQHEENTASVSSVKRQVAGVYVGLAR